MSINAPTLSEFLSGFEILVPMRVGTNQEYLMAYSYVPAVRRFQFRDVRTDKIAWSKQMYTAVKAAEVYATITPKKWSCV